MTAPAFTLTIPAAKSGDQIAAVLRMAADHFSHDVDGLTPWPEATDVQIKGETVAHWEVAA